ncbi:Crp/Fnr family transcriptional regulator [Arthrobacter mobilis]|uniref:Crp/Fnr family transcriptional regulator n=1 Tax=Arthrobacter mobilis TaxID=2724944 RepID=A0A7X6HAU4_9MICC|nr:Crp/Fnr family transcriptional regulator [Arthrobacter mobilis]NKX53681.1 Crp/Fnr family transcriptional regulator [Arthrobacter mobilis]
MTAEAGPGRVWSADSLTRQAVAASQLGGLPEPLLDELLYGTTRILVPAGTMTHREGDTAAHLELVVSGLLKFYATAPDGRTITVRYCRRGALIGVVSLFAPHFALPASAVALTDTSLLQLAAGRARAAAARELPVAHAFLRELSERVLGFMAEIPGSAFTSVRQRVARHLLDLAAGNDDGGQPVLPAAWPGAGPELAVHTTQQELAEAVGSVREVVVRILRELREAGVVRTERDRIVVVEPGRLAELAVWNPSS